MTLPLCESCKPSGVCQFGVIEQSLIAPHSSTGIVRCPPNFQGLPGMAHGGWIAAVFDEIMGREAWRHAPLIYTARLTVHFLKPVPVDRDLHYVVTSEPRAQRHWHVAAELRDGVDNLLLATGSGDFRHPRPSADRPATVA